MSCNCNQSCGCNNPYPQTPYDCVPDEEALNIRLTAAESRITELESVGPGDLADEVVARENGDVLLQEQIDALPLFSMVSVPPSTYFKSTDDIFDNTWKDVNIQANTENTTVTANAIYPLNTKYVMATLWIENTGTAAPTVSVRKNSSSQAITLLTTALAGTRSHLIVFIPVESNAFQIKTNDIADVTLRLTFIGYIA